MCLEQLLWGVLIGIVSSLLAGVLLGFFFEWRQRPLSSQIQSAVQSLGRDVSDLAHNGVDALCSQVMQLDTRLARGMKDLNSSVGVMSASVRDLVDFLRKQPPAGGKSGL